jgi:hypothetical protein
MGGGRLLLLVVSFVQGDQPARRACVQVVRGASPGRGAVMARFDYKGRALCDTCGTASVGGHECDSQDILREAIRKVVAQGMAQRLTAEVTARRVMQILAELDGWRA